MTNGMKWVFHDSARGYSRGNFRPDSRGNPSVRSERCEYGIVTSSRGWFPNKGDKLPGPTRSHYSVWLYHPRIVHGFVWTTYLDKLLSIRIIVVAWSGNLYCERRVSISVTFPTCRDTSPTMRLFFIAFNSANSVEESASASGIWKRYLTCRSYTQTWAWVPTFSSDEQTTAIPPHLS